MQAHMYSHDDQIGWIRIVFRVTVVIKFVLQLTVQ